MTELARRGSGSACRSMFGGVVHWSVNPEGSICRQLYPTSYWTELRVLICVVCDQTKAIGSRQAMERTVDTSQLYRHGRSTSVAAMEVKLLDALHRREFPAFAEVAMRESDQLHAVCLDTWPPCVFLNDTSWAIIRWVHLLNRVYGRLWVAYTFDAGPNAFLLTEERDLPFLLHLLVLSFGRSLESGPETGMGDHGKISASQAGETRELFISGERYPECTQSVDQNLFNNLPREEGGILRVISTKIGDGPQLMNATSLSPS